MKNRILSIVELTILFLFMPLSLCSEEIVGKWIQKNSYYRDYCKYYIFYENGRFEVHFGSLILSEYKIDNNILNVSNNFSDEDPKISKYFYAVHDNIMLFRRITSENPLKLSTAGRAVRIKGNNSENGESIVGQWLIVENNIQETLIEYTDSGSRIWLLPVTYSKGVYATNGERLALKIEGREQEDFIFSANDLVLSMEHKSFNKELYKRIK